MRKSSELPVNFIIILAIALVAGIVFLLFYFGVTRGSQDSLWAIKRNISDALINNTTHSISK